MLCYVMLCYFLCIYNIIIYQYIHIISDLPSGNQLSSAARQTASRTSGCQNWFGSTHPEPKNGFHQWAIPKIDGLYMFIRENPTRMDDLGLALFSETSKNQWQPLNLKLSLTSFGRDGGWKFSSDTVVVQDNTYTIYIYVYNMAGSNLFNFSKTGWS